MYVMYTLPANLVVIKKELHYKQSNQSMALKYMRSSEAQKFSNPELDFKGRAMTVWLIKMNILLIPKQWFNCSKDGSMYISC